MKRDASTLRWIRDALGRDGRWVALLTALRVLQGVEGTLAALVTRGAIDAATGGSGRGLFAHLAGLLALLALGVGLRTLTVYWEEKGSALLEKRLRGRIFRELMLRSYPAVTAVHTGEWLTRIHSDARIITQSLMQSLPRLLGLAGQIAAALAALFFLLPAAACFVVPGALLLLGTSALFRAKLKPLHKDVQRADGGVRSLMQEYLSSLIVVRAFVREERASDQANRRMDDWVDARMRRNRWTTLYALIVRVAAQGGYLLGIALCAAGLLRGDVGYGALVAVLQLIQQVGRPLTELSGFVPQYYAMLASAERMMEIERWPLDCPRPPRAPEEIRDTYDRSLASFGIRGAFAYEGQGAPMRFDLEIRKGEHVALVGESGSGKSTALKLLMGLYPLAEGGAFLRMRDGAEQALDASWRGLFAYVPQGNHLLSGTIREAVAFGDSALMERDEDIWAALRAACAEEFVRDLPGGLDGALGERGAGLSEGQVQRLAVARAVFSGRPILMLDEATSALDADTERRLLANLRTMADRTVLFISHRHAALDFCDRQIPFS